MKIKRPTLTAVQVLLVLGLSLIWVTSARDARPLNVFSASCEELNERFEQEFDEDSQEHFLPISTLCPAIREADALSFMRYFRTCVNSVAGRATGRPSGWRMPLRI